MLVSPRKSGSGPHRGSRQHVDRADRKHWREAVQFFTRNKSRLLRDSRYGGKYIAIRHRRVVDVDRDKWVLARRLQERFADGIYFVTQVVDDEPVYEVTSLVVGP